MVFPLRPADNVVEDLKDTPQDITGAWANLGVVIDCKDIRSIAIWAKIVINNAQNIRFRALGMASEDNGDKYQLPIRAVAATKVLVSPEYFELAEDVTQNIILPIDPDDLLPFVQIQVMAGTEGATKATILAGASFQKKET